jgi:hypothetical protein
MQEEAARTAAAVHDHRESQGAEQPDGLSATGGAGVSADDREGQDAAAGEPLSTDTFRMYHFKVQRAGGSALSGSGARALDRAVVPLREQPRRQQRAQSGVGSPLQNQ